MAQSKLSDILEGVIVGSLLGIRLHSELGIAWWRYAMAARHSASMEGRPNAGPQTWSSKSDMVDAAAVVVMMKTEASLNGV